MYMQQSTVVWEETVNSLIIFEFDSYKFTDIGRKETVNSTESEKQDLEFAHDVVLLQRETQTICL